MKFISTPLNGAFVIEPNPHHDKRGFFARSFCSNSFKEKGLDYNMVQSNISYSKEMHTLRGMHFQQNGHEEAKLIRCLKGSILDVIIDLRPESKTFCKHFSINLSSDKLELLYVPKNFVPVYTAMSEYFYEYDLDTENKKLFKKDNKYIFEIFFKV